MAGSSPDRRVRLWIVFPLAVFLLVGLSIRASIRHAPPVEESSESVGIDHPDEGDPLDMAWKRRLARLQEEPEFHDLLAGASNPEDAVQKIRDLSTKGISRLPDEALLQRVSLLATLVGRADEQTCAAILRNSPTTAQLHAAFLNLDREALDAWVDLIARAAEAELKKSEAPTVSEAQTTNALDALVHSFPPEESERLSNVLAGVADASDADACWAAKTFYAKIVVIGEPYDRILARGLVRD
jgi:hypothetical protein